MKLIKDLGMRFPTATSKRKSRYGLYECPLCNRQSEVVISNAKRASSCYSCSQAKKKTIHGNSKERLWRIWYVMNDRCSNPNNSVYKYYGAKGVSVCKEWADSYGEFKQWSLANGYKEGMEIDKDKLCKEFGLEVKIYSPKTCIWMSKTDNLKLQNGRKKYG